MLTSSTRPGPGCPTLFHRMSRPPNAATASRSMRWASISLVRSLGIPCDLTREIDAQRIVREAVAAFGGLDILWNNVGHPGPGRVEDVNMDDYDAAMTLNV